MEYKWLNKTESGKIILFFNGWGMDETVVSHLEPEKYDVLMFYDYNTLETSFDFSELDKYSEKHLIAWSMGVMCATKFDIKYNSKTAINGTLKPIDDNYGIPVKIYDLTVKGFSQAGLIRFVKNMGLDFGMAKSIKRDFENQKSELIALKGYNANMEFAYDKIIISNADKIIPTKNQTAFWGIESNIESGHSPFHLFKKWGELL